MAGGDALRGGPAQRRRHRRGDGHRIDGLRRGLGRRLRSGLSRCLLVALPQGLGHGRSSGTLVLLALLAVAAAAGGGSSGGSSSQPIAQNNTQQAAQNQGSQKPATPAAEQPAQDTKPAEGTNKPAEGAKPTEPAKEEEPAKPAQPARHDEIDDDIPF